ncbi:hypothetical protein [Caballeronia pedi]|uniref:hypothetical protein n=1 Tax=Caballeronia pedi TaxID=1777141 RepID=UPI001178C9F2|nr:hypothetical protein [Caballeronia pedi]
MSEFLWRTHAMKNADVSVLMLRESFVKRLREMRVIEAFFPLLWTMIRCVNERMSSDRNDLDSEVNQSEPPSGAS